MLVGFIIEVLTNPNPIEFKDLIEDPNLREKLFYYFPGAIALLTLFIYLLNRFKTIYENFNILGLIVEMIFIICLVEVERDALKDITN